MPRIFVFTDEPASAAGIQLLLQKHPGYLVVGTSGNVATLVEDAQEAQPEILLLDLTPDLTFSVLIELGERLPQAKAVLWTGSIPTELACQAMDLGIRGIVAKTLPTETLIKCLSMVAQGGLWFDEHLLAAVRAVRAVTLSRRESQLVKLLAHGLRNKEIATALGIGEGTVKVYLSRLFRKLEVNDRFELALYGLRNLFRPEAAPSPSAGHRASELVSRGFEKGSHEGLRFLVLDASRRAGPGHWDLPAPARSVRLGRPAA